MKNIFKRHTTVSYDIDWVDPYAQCSGTMAHFVAEADAIDYCDYLNKTVEERNDPCEYYVVKR